MSVKKDLKNIKFEKILEKNEYNCLKYRKKTSTREKFTKKRLQEENLKNISFILII